ncbi:dihydrofolate reductase family protein [Actinoallomurus bryophytorum]|uniref:Dihydrofolate reductase n=1 Tax=Actinoallomurus bryophytorum TaxID=1490222 RepID=A0A543CSC0_9ACTN|nr:dihydrofolate reductase family protein [Actinoallomurus bryophytorum]TQL99928.1 dihydrofolate reductase [Actinoallomurus bryophytorum]
MSSTVLYMSMSLDGFVAGPNERPDNGLGDGGERLHEWVVGGDGEQLDGGDREVLDDFLSTGAVLAGRGTFEPAGGWGGDHHDGVPIFILSRHRPAPPYAEWPAVTYLSDVEDAVRRAKEAAGEKNVLVHGVGTAQRCLLAGLLDEIEIHLVPVLLGEGRRLFEHLGAEHIELETIQVVRGREVTHLRYRVRR